MGRLSVLIHLALLRLPPPPEVSGNPGGDQSYTAALNPAVTQKRRDAPNADAAKRQQQSAAAYDLERDQSGQPVVFVSHVVPPFLA
jgi:hypothetical protein